MTDDERGQADALAAEFSRDGVRVSWQEFDWGESLGVKVNYPDGLRHAVRFDARYPGTLQAKFAEAVAACAAWHAENAREA